jgi:nuclear pore complex protein Nup155
MSADSADERAGTDEEADSLRTNAYSKALSVKDEFFHFELYDWYLSRGLTNQLLEVSCGQLTVVDTR